MPPRGESLDRVRGAANCVNQAPTWMRRPCRPEATDRPTDGQSAQGLPSMLFTRQGEAIPCSLPPSLRPAQWNSRQAPGSRCSAQRKAAGERQVETENGITLSTQPGWNARSAWNLGTKRNQEADRQLLPEIRMGVWGKESQP